MKKTTSGFTIVELLIVIVVIAILAAISVVAYTGIQNRAKNVQVQSDIRQVAGLIEMYRAEHGAYPSTGSISSVYSDNNCHLAVDSDGYRGTNWVPDMSSYVATLPQNPGLIGTGRSGGGGCYTYASDGVSYILSAWNARRGEPSTNTMYRRLGWREPGYFSANQYYCNHAYIGGVSSGVYTATADWYKYSYTISNISSCNETPPSGA